MTEKEILKRIYPSVVTFVGDWRKMMKDVSRLKLTEISLFLTCANKTERRKIYQALEKTKIKKIPHVHIRHDTTEEELDYLVKNYKTEAFVIHYQYLKRFKKSKHLKKFFIESNRGPGKIKSLKPFKKIGGICIDLSHIAMFKKTNPADFAMAEAASKQFKIGCNHISAILPNGRSWHRVKNIKELDYLKDISKRYFSRYINIELCNSIPEQLRFKKYVAKLLAKQWNKKS